MGTNFYLRHIPTQEQVNVMEKLLRERQFKKLQDAIHHYTTQYHIGKRSAGWQFLFAPHKGIGIYKTFETNPWDNTLESLKQCLSNPEYQIVDENDKIFTPDEFWNEEISHCLYNDPKHAINGSQYDDIDPYSDSSKYEFTTNEGLRFATSLNFN